MSRGYLFHPNSTASYRARTANASGAGISNPGWQCALCARRSSVVAGRKRSPDGRGFICKECAK